MSTKKEALVKRVGKLCEHQEIFEPAELSDSLRALSIPAQQQQLKQCHWQQVTSSAFERLPLQATRNDSTSIVQQPQSKELGQVTCLECLLLHEIRMLRLTVVLTILIAGASRSEEEDGACQASREAL
jgi:hypothetical protein